MGQMCSIRFKIKVLTTFICNKNQKNYTEILPRSKCLCIFNNQKIKSSWSLSLVSIGQNLFCFSVIHWINLILFHIHFHLNIRSIDKPAKKNGKNDHENYPERESKEQYDIDESIGILFLLLMHYIAGITDVKYMNIMMIKMRTTIVSRILITQPKRIKHLFFI